MALIYVSPSIETVHDPQGAQSAPQSATVPILDRPGDRNADGTSLTGAGDTGTNLDPSTTTTTIHRCEVNGSQDLSSKHDSHSTDSGAPTRTLDAAPVQKPSNLAVQEFDPSKLGRPVSMQEDSHGASGNTDTDINPKMNTNINTNSYTHPGVLSVSDSTSPTPRGSHQKHSIRNPPSPTTMSSVTNDTSLTAKTNRSGSSSGSGSTITQTSFSKHRSTENHRDKSGQDGNHESRDKFHGQSPKSQQRPDVMSFLEPDAPQVPRVSMPAAAAGQQHPPFQSRPWRLGDVPLPHHRQPASTKSTSSSTTGNFASAHGNGTGSDVSSDPTLYPETDTNSAVHGVNGGGPPPPVPSFRHGSRPMSSHHRTQQDHASQGGPEMPRENARLPYGSPNAFHARRPAPYDDHTIHLPRGEKLPMSGYELLATKLSAGNMHVGSGHTLKPMYRRFDVLNHRLLLHLQDELAELEEQLHRLDMADTHARRVQNYILPASRRQEVATTGELQWHKTDILGKVGFKLNQYNSVLSSFKDTQSLPSPHPDDIHTYRTYLATHGPVIDTETRFLDWEDDLVSLARHPGDAPMPHDVSDDMLTPMPRPSMRFPSVPGSPTSDAGCAESTRNAPLQPQNLDALHDSGYLLPRLVIAIAAAFLLPLLTFALIPSFVGRMAVVVLVCLGIFAVLLQWGFVRTGVGGADRWEGLGGPQDWTICLGVYGVVMAVVASFF
ncbi:hypothetical protein SODALDRAFT_359489 [Sodiomyces alkalinus F11]|uniref:DUF6594 domain-containing protein n=1 Tax=Sodiomyces alkalinus (strain CBS 110278 / VKM F-3762 / F11) TaxID=1314773 RepID=A0A3N2PV90_SODAK|nr:hypothetical protein SODALDRAFT_359489 [Sodiomyces alkalinus F11]ROT38398.1 hypothetical protein SODALDRAFT_359489 [Sodiomyces alkalinus F11]